MSATINDRFINPYNFVPFGRRSADADHAPSGHGTYGGDDLFSGTISCVLRVETPLLVLDQDAAADGEPVPVRLGPDAKPLILSTSVRGMLRGAYEAVTSSRLGVPIRGPFSVREATGRARGKRRQIQVAPCNLVSASVAPPVRLEEFSPADRLFGAVAPDGSASFSYRGSVRVGAVLAGRECRIRREDFRIAPLESPKPQQYGFYVRSASSAVGQLARAGTGSENRWVAGIAEGDELRGHKVYPHHADFSVADSESNAKSSKVVAGWVEPDAEFHFEVSVDAAEREDILPLLALLDLPGSSKAFHRLGGGRPLGFGSVRISVDWLKTDLRSGSDIREEYRAGLAGSATESLKESMTAYFSEHLGSSNQWQAWIASAKGYPGWDISYPPAQGKDSEGKNYEWFVRNARSKNPLTLPELGSADGPESVPTLPTRVSTSERREQQGGSRANSRERRKINEPRRAKRRS